MSAGRGTGIRLIAAAAVVAALAALVLWLDDEPSLQGDPVGRGAVSDSTDGPTPKPTTRPLEADMPAPDAGEVVPLVADELPPDAPPLPTEVRPESAMVVITGRVVDAYEAPVRGAELRFGLHGGDRSLQQPAWADPVSASYRRPSTQPVFSDADGRFAIHVDAAHARTQTRSHGWVVALAPGCAALPHRTPPLLEDAIDLGELRVAPGLSLLARVVDGEGRALPEVACQFLELHVTRTDDVRSGVRLSPQQDEQRFDEVLRAVLQGVSDDRGRLRIDHVPDGNGRLHLERDDLVPLTLPFEPLILPGPADLGDVVMDAGGTLAGTVVFVDDRPAEGAPVGILLRDDGTGRDAPTLLEDRRMGRIAELPEGRLKAMTVTDEHGRFGVSGLAAGVYELSAAANGHPWSHVVSVPAGQLDVTIVLAPGGTLQLDVRDALTGAPVAEPEVSVTAPESHAHLRYGHRWRHDVQVDPEVPGLVTIAGIGLEGASLTVNAAGYGPTALDEGAVPPGALVTREVQLDPALHVSGMVLDERDQPLAGVRVELSSLPRRGRPTEGLSDEQGRFRVDGLRAGSYEISARGPGLLETTRHDLELAGSWDDVVIRLDREAVVTGTVRDLHGEPAPGAVVIAWPLWGKPAQARREEEAGVDLLSHVWAPVPHTTADEQGDYRLGRMVPGSYAAFATTNDELADLLRSLRWNAQPYEVPDHAETIVASGEWELTQDLSLPVTTSLMGVVRHGQAPAAGAVVEHFQPLEAWPPWRLIASTTCDDQGAYELTHLEPGPCLVVARAEGAFPVARSLELAKAQLHRHDVTLGTTRVTGTVTEHGSGLPAVGVSVQVSPDVQEDATWIEATGFSHDDLRNLPSGSVSMAVTTTDAQGRYEIHGLPPGIVVAQAYGGGFLQAGTPWTTLRQDEVLDLSLELVRGARLEGTLTHRDGRPVDLQNLELALRDPVEGRGLGWASVQEGRWSFEGLEGGRYEVLVVDYEGDEDDVLLRTTVHVALGRTEHLDLLLDD